MAVSLIAAAFKADLPAVSKLLLVALADSANDDDGGCWFLLRTLCAKTSLSERGVRNHVRLLERSGYLRTEFRPGRSTVFFLNLSKLLGAQAHDSVSLARASGARVTPASGAGVGVIHTPARGAGTPACGAGTPARGAGTPARGAPISVSYPSLDPLFKLRKPDDLKKSFAGSRKPGPNGPGGRSSGLHASSEPDPVPQYSEEDRARNLARLRALLGSSKR